MPSPLQRHVAANLAPSVSASPRSGQSEGAPGLDRAQRGAGPKPQVRKDTVTRPACLHF